MNVLKVLVTGANGFIGRSLCERILTQGWQVVGSVRTLPAKGHQPEGVNLVQVDSLGPRTDWNIALNKIDTVIHLAARAHVLENTVADPLEVYRNVNVIGTERLAQAAATKGVRRFVYMSSVKVNGEGKPEPYTEKIEQEPSDPYSISKYEAEQALLKIADVTNLEIIILRPPLVYGPRVKANFLQLLKLIDKGIPLPLANVKNKRSFIFIGNLIDAVITCIGHPNAVGKTYLLSDGEDVATSELIRKIAFALNRPVRLFPCPQSMMYLAGNLLGRSEVLNRLLSSLSVDISKIQNELDWHPPYTMEQGLSETAHWFLKEFKKPELKLYDNLRI